MPTLILRTLVVLLLLVPGWAATTLVDDSDPRILYTGSWTKNPFSDPKDFNYGATLTSTNDTTAKATFTFSGAIQVEVFGSFPVAGTFSMHSQYIIDGSAATQFMPPSVISHPDYRQRFFTSGNLSTGVHQLVISNLGRGFYLDYIQLTLPPPSTVSSSPTPTRSSPPSVPAQGTSPIASRSASPMGSGSSSITVATQQQTTPTSQTMRASDNITSLGSSGVVSGASSSVDSSFAAAGSPSSSTETEASPVTSTETSQHSGAIILSPGIYVAIGLGSFTVLVLLVAVVCFLRHRRRVPRVLTNYVSPFDPGLTSIASNKSQSSRRLYAHVNRASSTASTLYHSAPPYTPVDETRRTGSMSHASSEGDILHISPDERGTHTEMACEPLGSPSVVSPLALSRHDRHQSDSYSPVMSSPVSPASKFRRATRRDTQELRRRSVDGGIRLAGGPSGPRREAVLADVDARSAVSTLPPLYQSYPAA